jgi:hypothetical protein
MQAGSACREARIAESLTAGGRVAASETSRPERPPQVEDLATKDLPYGHDLINRSVRHCDL